MSHFLRRFIKINKVTEPIGESKENLNAPIQYDATYITQDSAEINYSDNSAYETRIYIEIATDSGFTNVVASKHVPYDSFNEPFLGEFQQGTTYYSRIRNEYQETVDGQYNLYVSPWSNVVTFNTEEEDFFYDFVNITEHDPNSLTKTGGVNGASDASVKVFREMKSGVGYYRLKWQINNAGDASPANDYAVLFYHDAAFEPVDHNDPNAIIAIRVTGNTVNMLERGVAHGNVNTINSGDYLIVYQQQDTGNPDVAVGFFVEDRSLSTGQGTFIDYGNLVPEPIKVKIVAFNTNASAGNDYQFN